MIMKDPYGYGLWLDCNPLSSEVQNLWRPICASPLIIGRSPLLDRAGEELKRICSGLLDKPLSLTFIDGGSKPEGSFSLILGLQKDIKNYFSEDIPTWAGIKDEGYRFYFSKKTERLYILADSERGLLYGVFTLKRLMEDPATLPVNLDLLESPKIRLRMLNHWDNLDGSIERGYAGKTLWKWAELPATLDIRYSDYARALASVGINATVINNVNTQPEILSEEYLKKVAALAKLFSSWGISTFISVNFGSPRLLGGLKTSDPLAPEVIAWWERKVQEIYALSPNFGGFLVKADSEGQPGPFAYGRNHADGANMLARALAPHKGIDVWRAFVYGHGEEDRAKMGYLNFKPHDGDFLPNVAVQVKNGPIDFQPREPISPIFGAMEETSLFMEFQIAQEYLGQGNHIVYLAPMWKEVLAFDTEQGGLGKPVGKTLAEPPQKALWEGELHSGIAAVSNTGDDKNWCGSRFHQANWYAYGRLAWDWELDPAVIAKEWIRGTWTRETALVEEIWRFMDGTWEACINYMTPLGLMHIMREHHHYGPDPAFDGAEREDWRNTYYHRADAEGLGFNRTRTGSAMVDLYAPTVAERFNELKTCPEDYLLFFHHVPWNYILSTGRSLRDELVHRYSEGRKLIEAKQKAWQALKGKVDNDAWKEIAAKLDIQVADAEEWETVCVPYFLAFANKE